MNRYIRKPFRQRWIDRQSLNGRHWLQPKNRLDDQRPGALVPHLRRIGARIDTRVRKLVLRISTDALRHSEAGPQVGEIEQRSGQAQRLAIEAEPPQAKDNG